MYSLGLILGLCGPPPCPPAGCYRPACPPPAYCPQTACYAPPVQHVAHYRPAGCDSASRCLNPAGYKFSQNMVPLIGPDGKVFLMPESEFRERVLNPPGPTLRPLEAPTASGATASSRLAGRAGPGLP